MRRDRRRRDAHPSLFVALLGVTLFGAAASAHRKPATRKPAAAPKPAPAPVASKPEPAPTVHRYAMLVSQAQALLDMGKSADAFNLALQAIPLVPQRADADFLAGIAAYRQDLLDAAERQMRLALDRAPVDPSLPINRKLVSDAL